MTLERYEAPGMLQPATDGWTAVIEQVGDLASKIAGTEFVPSDYRGKPAAVAATILHGRELGLSPMTALAVTNPIKGKPSISAEAMRALVLQAGHELAMPESSSSRCVLKGRRQGSEEWTAVTWTMDDARRAQLSGANWTKYPRAMLLARATAELCRAIFPDVLHGLKAAEELADGFDQVTLVDPDEEPDPAPATTRVQRKQGQPAEQTAGQKSSPARTQSVQKPPARKRTELPAPRTRSTGATSGDVPAGQQTASPPEAGEADGSVPEHAESSADRPPHATAGAASPESSDGPGSSSHGPEPVAATTARDTDEYQREVRRLQAARQGQQPAPEDQDVVDAELVDEQTGEVAEDRDSAPKASQGQVASIVMHFQRLKIADDREERLATTATLAGVDQGVLSSSKDLTSAEAIRVVKQLERLKNVDQLDEHLKRIGEGKAKP